MIIKKSIILILSLIGTSLFAKGPLIDGEFQGFNPLDPSEPFRITFKLVDSETKIAACNFNWQCQGETNLANLRARVDSDMFAPNGDIGWRVAFEDAQQHKVFEVLFREVDGNQGIVLKLIGLGLDVPMQKIAH